MSSDAKKRGLALAVPDGYKYSTKLARLPDDSGAKSTEDEADRGFPDI
ncbi:hypothetical protein [Rhizobium sp. Rhizsp82]|jgi:hypothetical protein